MGRLLARWGQSVPKWTTIAIYALVSLSIQVAWSLPTMDEVKQRWRSSGVVLLDRHGVPIQMIRVDHKAYRGSWVTLHEVSPAFRHALILSEDHDFYKHHGVNWSAMGAAAWSNLWNSSKRGGSTITMQLIGLLRDDLRLHKDRRTFYQKAHQVWLARELETAWKKSHILEAYVNLVGFRGDIVGLEALSLALFDKKPSGLNYQESAIAVALLRAPQANYEQVAHRACGILQKIPSSSVTCPRLMLMTRQAFNHHTYFSKSSSGSFRQNLAPHFARYVLRHHYQNGVLPNKIYTTIDANLQRFAIQSLRQHLLELKKRHVEDGALLVVDQKTGEVLAWVGSSGPSLSLAPQVDGVLALRQAGSILKPFLYQQALDQGLLTAASLLDDRPIALNTASGLYAPQNYSHDFKGLVSVRTALASSLNIPAVRTIQMLTPEKFRDYLYHLGFRSLENDGDHYGFSLALGSADIPLLDAVQAYRTLGNQGLFSKLRVIMKQEPVQWERRTPRASSFIISDILADRVARSKSFGLESILSTPFWSAVKTGTSKDMRDNWAIGFSQNYTVGVWVGNAGGSPMWDVSGLHGAAPIWHAVLAYAQHHLRRANKLPTPPSFREAGVVRQHVRFEPNIEAKRTEYFIKGTERSLIQSFDPQKYHHVGIISPVTSTIIALDPDVPYKNQKMLWASHGVSNPEWWLDGKKIAVGSRYFWFPWPGHHELVLREKNNQRVLDKVQFSVRGALPKSS